MVEIIVAAIGVVTGLGGLVIALRTARASARKDDVEALRGIIAELRQEVEQWKQKYRELLARYERLEQMHDSLCEFVRGLGYDPDTRKGKESKLL